MNIEFCLADIDDHTRDEGSNDGPNEAEHDMLLKLWRHRFV